MTAAKESDANADVPKPDAAKPDAPKPETAASLTPEEVRADIARTRAELGATVDELTARLDVKARAKAKAAEVRDSATHTVEHAVARARKSMPDPLRPYTGRILAGLVAVALGAVTLVATRRHRDAY